MGSTKHLLAEEISKAFEVLKTHAAKIPLEKRREKCLEGTDGQISISDLIAYQIGWGQLLIHWYESGLQGQVPDMPGEGFLVWDYVGLANHFYQKYHLDGGTKQLELFRKTVGEVLSIVQNESASGQLEKTGVWEWCTLKSGKQWPLSKWIQVNTVAPYKKAAALIRRLL